MKKRTLAKLAMMSVLCGLLISAQNSPPSDNSGYGNTSNPFSSSAQGLLEKLNTIKAYYEAYNSGDSQKWLSLFSSNYKFNHPIYGLIVPNPTNGQMGMAQFFKMVMAERPDRNASVKNIYINPSNSDMIAVQLVFSFSVKGEGRLETEDVEIFTFAPQSNKIQSQTIIYDTPKVREAVKKNRNYSSLSTANTAEPSNEPFLMAASAWLASSRGKD